jgi:hypothetical protein
MSAKPWNERTEEEKYAHEPGSFNWCVDHFEIPGEPVLSRVIRNVCRHSTIWPEQLLGRPAAGLAVSDPGRPPLATGHSYEPRREGRFVFGRRLVWRGAYELTDLSIENIAELTGGLTPATVRPWARSWRLFEKNDPVWWRYWGLANADRIGVPLDEEAPA